ncbi:hypothetical protein SAMN06269250_0317 [Spirosoma fluviale]|uniref:Uncharacterized protein n=1 Tax=Spirosoma fluviale TaxID=1597977 RepID=A0A286F4L3_9BACT|nr:hypothetical protein SAMN06269250_0317 [Spirosoma fluviale]
MFVKYLFEFLWFCTNVESQRSLVRDTLPDLSFRLYEMMQEVDEAVGGRHLLRSGPSRKIKTGSLMSRFFKR